MTLLEKGWVEIRDGIKILHVSGSYYQMGFQYGHLLKDQIHENWRAFLARSKNSQEALREEFDILPDYWNVSKKFIPREYIEEIKGIMDGSEFPFDKNLFLNLFDNFSNDVGCSGFVAWDSATKNKKLYHARSLDSQMNRRDPRTGKYMHENQVIVVRKPEDGYASVIPSFAGDICNFGGINQNGISISWTSGYTNDPPSKGLPRNLKIKIILDHVSSIDEAIDILISNRTAALNIIISDWKKPIGYSIEQTTNFSYVGTWNNPVESIKPFYAIDHVIRRTNIFLNPNLATTQRKKYNPNVFPLISSLFRTDVFPSAHITFPASVSWMHYNALSKGIKKSLGNLDLNLIASMLRDVYKGKTDWRFFIAQKIKLYKPWHQWVVCPETGDLVISFAGPSKKTACTAPIHHFNIYKLINSKPPN